MDVQQAAANKYNEAAQKHAANLKGKAAVRADLHKAQGEKPAKGQVPQQDQGLNGEQKGNAGLKADFQKAMQSATKTPSPNAGPSR